MATIHDPLSVERPDVAQYLVNKEDGNKYVIGSKTVLDWYCANCGEIVHRSPVSFITNQNSLPLCKGCKKELGRRSIAWNEAHDLIGKRYGRLTVIGRAYDQKCKTKRSRMWLCRCDCGNEVVKPTHDLNRGHAKSCGCWRKEHMEEFTEKLAGRVTHGMSRERIFRIWSGMIKRCEDPSCKAYKNYGGRGIKVCDEWHSLDSFVDWAHKNGYAEDRSIDRIDNDSSYGPDNCRWADILTQANNKRNNVFITYNGETHTIPEWSRIIGISATTIRQRKRAGWSDEEAIGKPLYSHRS